MTEREIVWRIRAFNRYAGQNGFFAGLPTYMQAFINGQLVYGGHFFPPGNYIEWQDVHRQDLDGQPDLNDIPATWRGIHRYARANGYLTGFPNGESADYGKGVVYGAILLRQDPSIVFQDVYRAELDNQADLSTQPGLLMSDINLYAGRHNFNGGIPDFEEGDHGQGVLYGGFFFSGNLSTFRNVSMSDLIIVAGSPPETHYTVRG